MDPKQIKITRLSEGFTKSFLSMKHFLSVYIVKQNKQKSSRIQKKISWTFKIFKNRILPEAKFLKIRSFINLPVAMWGPTKNLGPIGSAVYWRLLDTNKQISKVYRIDRSSERSLFSMWLICMSLFGYKNFRSNVLS